METTAAKAPTRYVAFLDILGWASRVSSNFDDACEAYRTILELGRSEFGGVESVRFVSDSMLVVGEEPWPVIRAANAPHFLALANDCLVQGGVAYGRHIEFGENPRSHIVSEALIVAARYDTGHPCVVVDPSAMPQIDLDGWRKADTFLRPMLYYEGRWIVNPFSIMWGVSAANRVAQLGDAHPEHAAKYDWFLRLYQAAARRESLLPEV